MGDAAASPCPDAHQFWTVLAALVFQSAAPRPAGRVAGWFCWCSATVSLVDLAERLAPYDHALSSRRTSAPSRFVGLVQVAWRAFRHPPDAAPTVPCGVCDSATAALACFVLTHSCRREACDHPPRATSRRGARASLCPDPSARTLIPVAPLNYGVASIAVPTPPPKGYWPASAAPAPRRGGARTARALIPLYRLPDGTQAFAFRW